MSEGYPLCLEPLSAARCVPSRALRPRAYAAHVPVLRAYTAMQQLERASELAAAPRCVLGWTIVERDFDGEAFVLRALRLNDFLRSRGWTPADDGAAACSTLLHRSSGGSRQQVLTQFWVKACRVEARVRLIMLAKDCSYAAAQTLLHRIMQDYYMGQMWR